ncbi:hypothetical protein [Weissella bombi]|uniref:Uncharacterized protein n=1 Tax=Weissella bombi TaxID=1505725 RepID=A0A1C4C0N5_9LACO|nr:hypothetical protein [Weissella bombi]SCC12671.1 hypothetical protein GA0061074_11910 [Weissella bombi]
MTKTVDEYIAHAAHKQAEADYYQVMSSMQKTANDFALDGFFTVSMGDKDEIIAAQAERIEISMKNKLVEILVNNDDR